MDGKGNITSELSVVIVGGSRSGKTSLFSTLLGWPNPQDQKTATCVKSNGHLRGIKLTVVDTPGWWRDYTLTDTAARIKHQLVLSVHLSPPGPHAFILTVEIGKFTIRNQRAVEEHLGLFGENIWGHTIVVFTREEYLKGRTIEQHIESEGETLKWLLQKCGNRYCVFETHTRDPKQVIELLEKIKCLEEHNNGRHFEIDNKMLREVKEKKKVAEEQASARRVMVEERRQKLEGQVQPVSDVRIVMLGWVSCGKSSAKNIILNKEDSAPLHRTEQCEKETEMVGDRSITVVDTPGWWKYFSAQYIPEWVKTELEGSVTLGSKAPHALLLVVPADVSFLEEQRKIIKENMKMFIGEIAWRHTLILFTWGDSLGSTSIEEHIESEGKPLRWLVEKCGNRYHVFDNINRGDGSQVHQLLQKIDEMEVSMGWVQKTPETEATEAYRQVEVKKEMVEYLDREWTRRDKELEEKVIIKWQEMFGSAVPLRGNQSLNHIPDFEEGSLDTTVEKLSAELPGQAEHEPHEQTSGGVVEVLESLRREWARREAITMEKVQIIVSELYSQSRVPSEPDEHEILEARQKVFKWLKGSSGLGSELEDGDVSPV